MNSNGTVLVAGKGEDGQFNVSDWKNIIAISAGFWHLIGLKSDGTVVSANPQKSFFASILRKNDNLFTNPSLNSVQEWTEIIAIAAGSHHIVGLKSDGTVVVEGCKFNVSNWKDIVAISAGCGITVGLKADGTVVANGITRREGQNNISDWKDIVAISAGATHAVGLKSDGTVVAVGDNTFYKCNVSDWKDIVAISAGTNHTIGLKSDGTVVAVGGQYTACDVRKWKLF